MVGLEYALSSIGDSSGTTYIEDQYGDVHDGHEPGRATENADVVVKDGVLKYITSDFTMSTIIEIDNWSNFVRDTKRRYPGVDLNVKIVGSIRLA